MSRGREKEDRVFTVEDTLSGGEGRPGQLTLEKGGGMGARGGEAWGRDRREAGEGWGNVGNGEGRQEQLECALRAELVVVGMDIVVVWVILFEVELRTGGELLE